LYFDPHWIRINLTNELPIFPEISEINDPRKLRKRSVEKIECSEKNVFQEG